MLVCMNDCKQNTWNEYYEIWPLNNSISACSFFVKCGFFYCEDGVALYTKHIHTHSCIYVCICCPESCTSLVLQPKFSLSKQL